MSKIFIFIQKHLLIFVGAILIIFSIFVFCLLYNGAVNDVKIKFEKDSSSRVVNIFDRIEHGVKQLNLLKTFYECSDFVSPKEFKNFSDILMKSKDVGVISSAMFVKQRNLQDFESKMTSLTGEIFKANQFNEHQLNTVREYENCVVVYAEASKTYIKSIGLNLLSENKRAEAIKACVDLNKEIACVPFDVSNSTDNNFFIMFIPIMKKSNAKTVMGIAAANFYVNDIFENAINPTPKQNIYTDFYDVTEDEHKLIYKWKPRLSDDSAGKLFLTGFYPNDIEYKFIQEIAGRKWMIVTKPGKAYLKNNFSIKFMYIVSILIFLMFFLFHYIYKLQKRLLFTESVVSEKNKSLVKKSWELDKFFDTSIDLFCIADFDGKFIKLNKEWEKTLGYKLSDITGKKFIDFVHPDDKEMTNNALLQLSNGHDVINLINRCKYKDGNYKWIEWRSSATDGIIYAAARDITERKITEQSLIDSEANFKTAFITSPDIIAINRLSDSVYVMVNEGYLQKSGYTREEVIGKTSKEMNIWKNYDEREKFVEIMKKNRSVNSLQFDFRMKNGKILKCLLSAKMMKLNNEMHIMVNVKDITERIEYEEKLKDREFWLQESQKAAKVGSYIFNIAENSWTCTSTLDEIFGIDKNYVKTFESWDLIVHPDEAKDMKTYFNNVIKTKTDFNKRYRIQRISDKSIHWVYGRGIISYDDKGNPLKMIGTIQDVSDIENSNILIQENEKKLTSLINNMIEGVAFHEYIYDNNGIPYDYKIIDINPQYENIIGLKKTSIANKSSMEIYNTKVPPYLTEFSVPFKTGAGMVFETYFESLDKFFLISVSPWGKNGFATIFSDISDRKNHEKEIEKNMIELEEKNSELERFTYTVSHDLKNPLITIVGFTGVLKKHIANNNLKEIENDLKLITGAGEMMNRLLDDLLEISKAGKISVNPERLLFKDIVHQAAGVVAGELKSKNAEFTIADGLEELTDKEAYIFADKTKMIEIIQNLLSNAIKFSRKNVPPKIEIGVKFRYNFHDRVFYIKDNGIGIEKQYLTKIFGLFERLNPEIDGTGVGLAIVKRIIESNGGSIWAESDGHDTGTTIYFTIDEVKKRGV